MREDLVDRWQADGLDASTIRNTLLPLRATYGRAIRRGVVAVNPTTGLELPAVKGHRDRVASPQEAAALVAALGSEHDAAVWATAFYAGLRYGELRGLRWEDVDLDGGVIRVRRSWDAQAGEIAPKSKAGERTVPIVAVLRPRLVAQRLASGRAVGLVFGPDGTRPFPPESLTNRTRKARQVLNEQRAEQEQRPIEPLTLHEARHTCASLWIAAGVNVKALQTYMGHASITVTMDRYEHLLPGAEQEAAALLDRYLAAVEAC